jgi:hypothetical protein
MGSLLEGHGLIPPCCLNQILHAWKPRRTKVYMRHISATLGDCCYGLPIEKKSGMHLWLRLLPHFKNCRNASLEKKSLREESCIAMTRSGDRDHAAGAKSVPLAPLNIAGAQL